MVQTGVIPTDLPSFPWNAGDPLDAVPLNNEFYILLNQIAAQQTQIAALQASGPGSGAGISASVTIDWAGGAYITAGTYVLSATAPYGFVVASMDCHVGNGAGNFTVTITVNGIPVTGLTNIVVSQATKVRTLALGAALVLAGDELDMIISAVNGAPTNCYVCVNSVSTAASALAGSIGIAVGSAVCGAVSSTSATTGVFVMDDPIFGALDSFPLS